MKTIQTIQLTGDDLLAAVAIALRKSYTELSFEVGAMGLDQLTEYLDAHPEIELGDALLDNEAALRDIILSSHEPLLPGDDDIAEATQEDLWPLCEQLLERYNLSLTQRVDGSTGRKFWLAGAPHLHIAGSSPREAILHYYVFIKLGSEVNLDD